MPAGTVEEMAGTAVGCVTPPELAAGVAAGWMLATVAWLYLEVLYLLARLRSG